MAKVPGFAKAFVGRWRIVEMDNWDSDFLDLVEEAVALHSDYDGLRLAVRLAPAGVLGGGLYGHSRIACSSLDPNQIGLATGTA